ncbi:uncharacterized mitochondrial protein-like protein [Tanacetum coccineum]|uniref:Uncharacterized mitochondrial protein-like protein n=1 Tax=Tanacetum coccineum TaxID=301880 RepID=A0ABQ5FS98_9ASTR
MWEAIQTHNLGVDRVKEARLQTLIMEFKNMKMSDNDSIDAYAAKLSGFAFKSATLGEVMSEHKLVQKFLTSLPGSFIHIVAALENSDSSRGRGRGSYSRGRGQGPGQGNSQNQGQRDFSKNREDNRQKDQKQDYDENLSETHEGDVNHEEGNYSYFSELNENITSHIKFGDGSCVRIKGKGFILFQGKNGEQKLLKDIYYIPALRSNVIRLGQATISGCDIRIRVNLMHKLAKGVPVIKHQDQVCESCMVGKKTKKSFSKKATYRASKILEMVHGDICGPITPSTQAGYSDSSHNVDIERSTTGHVFYLGTSPITWCSQKQTTVALSSCEAEFMAATSAACQAIWLRELLAEVTGLERQNVIIRVDNKSAIALSKNPVFHGRSKHIHTRYHFIRECVENEQVIVEHVSGENQRADPLTKALARIRFKEMRSLLGVQELPSSTQKFRG